MKTRRFLAKFVRPLLPYIAQYKYKNQRTHIIEAGGKKKKKGIVPYSDFLASYTKDLNMWIQQGYVD